MSIHYKSNEQIVIEIKKLMLEKQISQREIAEQLNIKPQGLTKLLNKKNFGFEDAQKILSAMGYDLIIDFEQLADLWGVFIYIMILLHFICFAPTDEKEPLTAAASHLIPSLSLTVAVFLCFRECRISPLPLFRVSEMSQYPFRTGAMDE